VVVVVLVLVFVVVVVLVLVFVVVVVLVLVFVVVVVLVLVFVVFYRISSVCFSLVHFFIIKATLSPQTLAEGSEHAVSGSGVRERGQVQSRSE
jgi:hypothetical protein